MRVSQDKLTPAIGLGRAVPDSQICKPRAKGELRVPPDKVRREVVAALQACSAPGHKGRETPFAQVVTALGPWWGKNQDSTLPEVLADLIAPRGKGALAAEVADKVGRLTLERVEAVAMANDKERRAVAARMREIMRDDPHGWLDMMVAKAVVDVMGEGVTVGETLADLIDRPTTSNVGEPPEFVCKLCGAVWPEELGFAHCPECGAEVTDGD